MKLHTLHQTQTLPVTAEAAWTFFSNPANLSHLTPPELRMRRPGGDPTAPVYPGQWLWFDIQLAPFVWQTWVTEITQVEPGRSFIDEQRAGPYRFWRHRHLITPLPSGGCEVTDTVYYALPFQPLGELAHPLLVRPLLKKIFAYRRQSLARLLGSEAIPTPSAQSPA